MRTCKKAEDVIVGDRLSSGFYVEEISFIRNSRVILRSAVTPGEFPGLSQSFEESDIVDMWYG